jgi:hypothetical protein
MATSAPVSSPPPPASDASSPGGGDDDDDEPHAVAPTNTSIRSATKKTCRAERIEEDYQT